MRVFTEHPHSVQESYGTHLAHALWFSGAMLKGAIVCAVHAFLPFLFIRTGSETIKTLHDRMVVNRASPNGDDRG